MRDPYIIATIFYQKTSAPRSPPGASFLVAPSADDRRLFPVLRAPPPPAVSQCLGGTSATPPECHVPMAPLVLKGKLLGLGDTREGDGEDDAVRLVGLPVHLSLTLT